MAINAAARAQADESIEALLFFYTVAEKLKCVERDNLLSNGKFESVAGHCWMLGLMAMLLAPKMKTPINLERVFKIIMVHDLAEAKTGDLPLGEAIKDPAAKAKKMEAESVAMRDISGLLPPEDGREIYELWREYEENQTVEAKFVKGLDKIEAFAQALAYKDVSYWPEVYYAIELQGQKSKYYAHEPVLMELAEALKSKLADRMRSVGLDPEKYQKR